MRCPVGAQTSRPTVEGALQLLKSATDFDVISDEESLLRKRVDDYNKWLQESEGVLQSADPSALRVLNTYVDGARLGFDLGSRGRELQQLLWEIRVRDAQRMLKSIPIGGDASAALAVCAELLQDECANGDTMASLQAAMNERVPEKQGGKAWLHLVLPASRPGGVLERKPLLAQVR